jgi:hypothetical protein
VPRSDSGTASDTARRRSPLQSLVDTARGAVVAYVAGWVLSIVVATILGRVVPASIAERLDGVLRTAYTSVPPIWGLVSFLARVYYCGLLDLRIFGPSPASEQFSKPEQLAMVMVTLMLAIVLGVVGVVAIRRHLARP